LRSPFARAVVPVLAGAGLIAALGLFTWGVAAFISRGGAETSERLVPSTLRLGHVDDVSDEITEDGPLLLPGLNTTIGERSLVVDHEGDDPTRGWVVYFAYPDDRDPACVVEQVRGTRQFTDCDGRTIDVTDLAPPLPGVRPIVENREWLVLDLRSVTPG
jgi:hypothetical protein